MIKFSTSRLAPMLTVTLPVTVTLIKLQDCPFGTVTLP